MSPFMGRVNAFGAWRAVASERRENAGDLEGVQDGRIE
jgi:hypothetical protein